MSIIDDILPLETLFRRRRSQVMIQTMKQSALKKLTLEQKCFELYGKYKRPADD